MTHDAQPPRVSVTSQQIAWLAAGFALLVLTLARANPQIVSFQAFYDSGLSWRTGSPIVTPAAVLPNLNPPLFAVLIAPLTVWSVHAAFMIWTALGACSLAAGVIAMIRAGHLPLNRAAWVVGAFGATVPSLIAWEDGQVTWILFYPATQAWIAATRLPFRAGLWLAPVIAIKPPLALMGALLPWRVTLSAALGSIALTAAGIMLTGWTPWRTWLDLSGQVTWLEWPLSASLWSTAARFQTAQITGSSMSDLSRWWWALILPLAALLAWPVFRARGSARWVLAYYWATLVSPLGQVYYLPLAAGPMAQSWPRHRGALAALAMACVPLPLLGRLAAGNDVLTTVLGSSYFVAVLLAWFAWRSVSGRRDCARNGADETST